MPEENMKLWEHTIETEQWRGIKHIPLAISKPAICVTDRKGDMDIGRSN